MPCSPEKLEANRKNSKLSKGPSPAGREISRKNGLKHGLTGAGVVILDEDVAEVDARFASFERDLKPKNDVARFLARQAAMLSVRIERCVRNEAAALNRAMLHATEDEAEDRAEFRAELIAALATDPVYAVRNLRRSPEGLDWLIESTEDLKEEWLDPRARLEYAKWYDRAERLGGRAPNTAKFVRVLDHADAQSLIGDDRRRFLTSFLLARLEADLAHLREVRDGLDLEAIALDRSGASARAIFDPSHEATLARRYEAAATRDFFKSLKQIETINQQENEPEILDASSSPITDCAELASSCKTEPDTPSESPENLPETPEAPETRSLSIEENPDTPPGRLPNPDEVADSARFSILRE